jgi:hypothetical protein
MDIQANRWLTRTEASAFLATLGIERKPQTLAAYAVRGGGPAYRLFGRKPYYAVADLEAWVEEKFSPVYRTTSQYERAAA